MAKKKPVDVKALRAMQKVANRLLKVASKVRVKVTDPEIQKSNAVQKWCRAVEKKLTKLFYGDVKTKRVIY